jgi:predicted dehydrogenase
VTSRTIRWGVLGAAKIATAKVIPAMQRSAICRVTAIASRDLARAREAGEALGIESVYGRYDEVLDDPDVDAVYIPLPNHLHVEWTLKAMAAGKHVLCEKPLGLTADDLAPLAAARDRAGVKLQEAFMVRTHPQWLWAREYVTSGRLGDLVAMTGTFSYYNDDAANIRNISAYGGGALLDIGCYLVMTSRFIFGGEPVRVSATSAIDSRFGTDVRTSMILEYPRGSMTGLCATQMAPRQHLEIHGTRGRMQVEIPFNPIADRPSRVLIDRGGALDGSTLETTEFPACDQYTIQGDAFAQAILAGTREPYPLEESIANMRVLDAIARSARSGRAVDMSAAAGVAS